LAHNNKENTIGLEIADLCAYPLARHILNPSEPYIPFKIIEDKIYCKNKGEYEGWGLKIFPKSKKSPFLETFYRPGTPRSHFETNLSESSILNLY